MNILTATPTDFDGIEAGDIFKMVTESYGHVTVEYVLVTDNYVSGGNRWLACWLLTPPKYGAATLKRGYIPLSDVSEKFAPLSMGEALFIWREAHDSVRIASSEARVAAQKAEGALAAFDSLADEVWGII